MLQESGTPGVLTVRELIELFRTYKDSLGAIELKEKENYTLHPYAHPKKSVIGRDEKGR